MKWILVAVAIVAVLFTAAYIRANMFTNPGVMDELRANPDGERAKKVLILTFPDGKTIPVNYLWEGDKVYVGADGPWWRVFRQRAAVTMFIRGQTLKGTGVAVLDDPAYTEDVFSRLRPTVPEWLPDWLNGTLVELTLQPDNP